MIVDTSALAAVFFREPGFDALLVKLAQAEAVGIGAPTLVEAGIVLTARLGFDARAGLTRFLTEAAIVVVPFGDAHWRRSVEAYVTFGKGRHPAGLNFGDCLSYATAKLAGRPLLCVGDDFARTDVGIA